MYLPYKVWWNSPWVLSSTRASLNGMPKTPRMKIEYFGDVQEDENSEPNETWEKKLGVLG